MIIIAVTRLRIRSFRFLLRLHWEAWKIRRTLEKAPGFLRGKLLTDRNRAFWTMSAWKDIESMRAFRNSKAHASGMLKLSRWCDEASVVHWEKEGDELPDWSEAHRRMSEDGRLSPLKFQSADHKAHRFKTPRVTRRHLEDVLPRG